MISKIVAELESDTNSLSTGLSIETVDEDLSLSTIISTMLENMELEEAVKYIDHNLKHLINYQKYLSRCFIDQHTHIYTYLEYLEHKVHV